jgi:LmbE family N-acetylglucosaminyl deacetylase
MKSTFLLSRVPDAWLAAAFFSLPGCLAAGVCLLAGLFVPVRAADTPAAGEPPPATVPPVLQDLRSFRELGSVLYVAAHPDDENTQLITYLARGRGARTAYLSLTRGDGGQNVLGPEFGSELGVARTQELLAARRLDGGRQFFTRALDFGFSKTAAETLTIWDRQQVVADIVRVIRTFRPDVMATRFSPAGGGGHGHHTASAVLAIEAFKLAGNAEAFPEHFKDGLTPWQPKRILQNGGGFGGRGGGSAPAASAGVVRLEVGGNDPVTGEGFGAIASRSRGMHKTQGFGGGFGPGGAGSGPRQESFTLLAGEPATNDIFDGIDTTWARFPGGAAVAALADAAIAQFKPDDPAASVPALLALRAKLAALPADPVVADKRTQFDRILQTCLGLTVTTAATVPEAVPGETLRLRHTVGVRAGLPVRWVAVRFPAAQKEVKIDLVLTPTQFDVHQTTPTLPAATPPSQPYWLRAEGTPGMARVDQLPLVGRPENPPAFPVELVFEVGGQTLVVADEPVQVSRDSAGKETRRRLEVIPPVAVSFPDEVELFVPGTQRTIALEIVAARSGAAGTLQLEVPAGWQVTPPSARFALGRAGDRTRCNFTLTAPAQAATAVVGAVADVGGIRCRTGRKEIRYEHIPLQLLQPTARLKAVSLDLAKRGKTVGYLPGAGDDTAHALMDMGYAVTELTGADLSPEKLKNFDAVVLGVRAFNVRTDLVAGLPALFAYVEGGGTVVAQYNRPGRDLKTEQLAPYALRLSNDRVTDENAAVTFLAPEHPVLNGPNKITAADFAGWVQERGVYFPNQWAEPFAPILACGDAGEEPLKSGLLIAKHGRGYFVYTGLAFFRQLPAGVPGAYRLFANLVSLGK